MVQDPEKSDDQAVIGETPAESTKKKKRPDGTDLDRYKGLEKWSYRRWAWEFLKRNKQFRAACKRVDSEGSDEEKLHVATQFGLKKFKSHLEPYSVHSRSGLPKFSIGSISSWSYLDCNDDEYGTVKTTLDSGQVLVRFDLASALADIHVLEKQLRTAEFSLKKRLRQYAENKKMKVQTRRIKVTTLGQYLRMLDLHATGRKQIDIGRLIAPDKAKDIYDDEKKLIKEEFAQAISRKMKKAVQYSTELYRFLAVLKGRPDVQSISLEEPRRKSN